MKVGIVTRPVANETECGDAGRWWQDGRRSILCLADGLGHGPKAAVAATTALNHLAAQADTDLETLFAGCDQATRRTRGVALAIAVIESDPHRLRFAAIGNIRAALIRDRSILLPGDCGIIGAGFRRLVPFEIQWQLGDILVMWTDGLLPTLSLNSVPADLRFSPDAIAEWLADTFATGTDDVGVICARLETAT